MIAPLTQKARGVCAMKMWGPTRPYVPDFYLVQQAGDIEELRKRVALTGWFARFCPPSPEHGYIESRVMQSWEHLYEMLKETKAVHGGSEIMLMPHWDDQQLLGSFVWTPTQVVVGPGHDGATAGKPGCLRLPLMPSSLHPELLKAAGVPEGTSPYVEGLIPHSPFDGSPKLVQLRYGPEPPAVLDYVPEPVVVTQIVPAEGDLIEFAKIVKALPVGAVVDHVGGALTSHYGVHCVTNGVPVMTTRKVEIGERLEPVMPVMPEQQPAEVVKWLLFASRDAKSRTWTDSAMRAACNASLFVVHNAATMGEYPQLVGAALSSLLKLCTIACHGEARHWHSDAKHGVARGSVFRFGLKNSAKAVAALPLKLGEFDQMGSFPTGYGGQAWGRCTRVTMDLMRVIQALIAAPSQETLAAALSQANIVVNEAHNGGWWLNKFTDASVFEACSHGAPQAVGLAYPGLQGFLASATGVKPSVIKRVAGFRKNVMLKVPMPQDPPKIIGKKHNFMINPVSGEMYVVGPRWGWSWDLPKGLVSEARAGKLPLCWERHGMDTWDGWSDGNVMLRFNGPAGYFGWSGGQGLTVPVKGLRTWDLQARPDAVRPKILTDLVREGWLYPPGMVLAILGLCESCGTILQVSAETKCPDCGGKERSAVMCTCGNAVEVEMHTGGEHTQACWGCLWEKLMVLEDAERESKKKENSVQVEQISALCVGKYCSAPVSAHDGTDNCGCVKWHNMPKGKSLTFAALQGLK